MRVLVTGGAGFIGGNLCQYLAMRAHDVVAIDDLSTGDRRNVGESGTRLVVGSILDSGALRESVKGVDAIVHLAARPSVPRSIADPVKSNDVNVTGTIAVLELAREFGFAPVVVASSSSVYGASQVLPKAEDLMPRPISPYAVSKLAAENYALAYQHCYGLPVIAFRFFNVFGPLQAAGHPYAAVIPSFVDAALRGEPLLVYGDGRQTRDFTYVGTIVRLLASAVEDQVSFDGPVNLAFGSRISLLEVINELSKTLGRGLEVDHQPPRHGDVRHSEADNSRLLQLFPDAAPVSFDEGLRRTVDWFLSR